MPLPTITEMEADYHATDRDFKRLDAICLNLSAFIAESAGEDRRAYRFDLMKYESLRQQAVDLKQRIHKAITAAKVKQQTANTGA